MGCLTNSSQRVEMRVELSQRGPSSYIPVSPGLSKRGSSVSLADVVGIRGSAYSSADVGLTL